MFHVIDGLPETRDLLKEQIECAGYDSMQFDSAKSYLEYFNSPEFITPVAILSGYLMHGKTGIELVKQVRKKLPLQRAVIVSGVDDSLLHATIKSYLCYSLAKPYHMEELFSLLEVLVKCEKRYQSKPEALQAHCEFGLEHECPHCSGLPAKE
jgi:DNA-binding NtrC family response regulator